MAFSTKEKLAIREAIHAMKWLDKHHDGWGLEEECAILENICSNCRENEIKSNHNYLDLQYQLDSAEAEVSKLQLEIKKNKEELSDYWQVHDEQVTIIKTQTYEIKRLQNEIDIIKKRSEHNDLQDAASARQQMDIIKRLREEIKILKLGEKAANELILRGRAAEECIPLLMDEIKKLQTLRSDIITAINRPKTTSDTGLLLYIKDEVDYNIRQAARIKELEGREEDLFTCYNCGKKVDDVEPGPILGEIHFDPGYPGGQYEPPEPAVAYFVCTCCLRAEGKIGPDARPKCDHAWQAAIEERGYQTCLKCGECRNIKDIPRTAPTWQITDERILAIENAISSCVLIERYTGQDLQHETAVLRTMLREG